MNNTQNLVNNGDNAILQQKNYPLDISEYEKMCSSHLTLKDIKEKKCLR